MHTGHPKHEPGCWLNRTGTVRSIVRVEDEPVYLVANLFGHPCGQTRDTPVFVTPRSVSRLVGGLFHPRGTCYGGNSHVKYFLFYLYSYFSTLHSYLGRIILVWNIWKFSRFIVISCEVITNMGKSLINNFFLSVPVKSAVRVNAFFFLNQN